MWGNRGNKMLGWRSPGKRVGHWAEMLECGATGGRDAGMEAS